MKEKDYQAKLIQKIKLRYRNCVVMKNDASYIQGIPDLSILYKSLWAMLEVKKTNDSNTQPNQDYYVNKLHGMSFAAYIHPGNEKEVFSLLDKHFLRSVGD